MRNKKVSCKNCGKKFKYDIYSGVCPKCGTYMYPQEMEMPQMKTSNAQTNLSSVKPRHIHQTGDQISQQTAHITSAVVKVLLLILMTIILLLPFGYYFRYDKQKERTAKEIERMAVENIKESVYQAGEKIPFETVDNRYDITITGATIDEDKNFVLPDGCEVVVVTYKIERTNISGEKDYDSYYSYSLSPYLETKSGIYLSPLLESTVQKQKKLTDDEAIKKMKVSSEFEYDCGKLYFVVKKEDVKGLYITRQAYEHPEYKNGKLYECYRIEGLEVAR